MIKADVPQDVTEYKEQFFLGMTGRQIVCVVLMIALAVVTFLIGNNFVTTDILTYLVVLEVAPLAAVGFLKYNGMGFEKIIVKVCDFYFGNQRRKISYLPEETEILDAVRAIRLSIEEKERAAELKELKLCRKAERKEEKRQAKAERKENKAIAKAERKEKKKQAKAEKKERSVNNNA